VRRKERDDIKKDNHYKKNKKKHGSLYTFSAKHKTHQRTREQTPIPTLTKVYNINLMTEA
jgi:hypothetical protein